MFSLKPYFFWQPKTDFLKVITSTVNGKRLLIILNYLIWVFLFYCSFILIKHSANTFWQIFFATLMTEFVERVLKAKIFWKRPLFERKDQIPTGLVKSWYQTGSFPSGHTSKAIFFLLFILQYQVLNPIIFLFVTIPLLVFRVLVGFHYPIDIIGGIIVGLVSWVIVKDLVFPPYLVESIRLIFNSVFFIK